MQKTGFHKTDIALPELFGKDEVDSGVRVGFLFEGFLMGWNGPLAVSDGALYRSSCVAEGGRCRLRIGKPWREFLFDREQDRGMHEQGGFDSQAFD